VAFLDNCHAAENLHIWSAAPKLRKDYLLPSQLVALDLGQIRKAHAFALAVVATYAAGIMCRNSAYRLRKYTNGSPAAAGFLAFGFSARYVELRTASLDRRWICRAADRGPGSIGA
jgi:hypothetical protein